MSLEAAAGKNPVTHVGKLYNVMAHRIAHAVVSEIPEVEEGYCYLRSRIGQPIADPQLFENQSPAPRCQATRCLEAADSGRRTDDVLPNRLDLARRGRGHAPIVVRTAW